MSQVDDLQGKTASGADFVKRSARVLALFSHGFFGGDHPPSKACVLEVLSAIRSGVPIVAMLEVEDKHNPLSVNNIIHQIHALDAPCMCDENKLQFSSTYTKMNIINEVAEAGLGHPPIGEQICEHIFRKDVEPIGCATPALDFPSVCHPLDHVRS